MEEECWKDVVGYEGLYRVSNYGVIIGLYRRRHGKPLSAAKNNKGYRYVILYKNGQKRCYKVYRIVASAFIPNPDNLPEIDHIDGSRDNDCSWNLRWCSHAENINNPITRKRLRLATMGSRNPFYGKHHSEASKQKIRNTKLLKKK